MYTRAAALAVFSHTGSGSQDVSVWEVWTQSHRRRERVVTYQATYTLAGAQDPLNCGGGKRPKGPIPRIRGKMQPRPRRPKGPCDRIVAERPHVRARSEEPRHGEHASPSGRLVSLSPSQTQTHITARSAVRLRVLGGLNQAGRGRSERMGVRPYKLQERSSGRSQ